MEGENQVNLLGNDAAVVVVPNEQVEIFLGKFEEIAVTGDNPQFYELLLFRDLVLLRGKR